MKTPKKTVLTRKFCFTLKDDGTYSVKMRMPFSMYFVVRIPKSIKGIPVTEIAPKAFLFSIHLRKVKIPASIKKIGRSPFLACPKFKKIVFKGTISQWGKIEKETYDKSWRKYPLYCKRVTFKEIHENPITEEEDKIIQEILERAEK